MRYDLLAYSESNRCKLVSWSNWKREDSLFGLGAVVQQVLCVEAGSVREV